MHTSFPLINEMTFLYLIKTSIRTFSVVSVSLMHTQRLFYYFTFHFHSVWGAIKSSSLVFTGIISYFKSVEGKMIYWLHRNTLERKTSLFDKAFSFAFSRDDMRGNVGDDLSNCGLLRMIVTVPYVQSLDFLTVISCISIRVEELKECGFGREKYYLSNCKIFWNFFLV